MPLDLLCSWVTSANKNLVEPPSDGVGIGGIGTGLGRLVTNHIGHSGTWVCNFHSDHFKEGKDLKGAGGGTFFHTKSDGYKEWGAS